MENTSNTAATGSTSRSPNAVPHSDSIMMWGAKGSGKSVYIASLVYWSPPAEFAGSTHTRRAASAGGLQYTSDAM